MNINKVIKRIKDDLGLSKFLKLSYSDKDIYDVIINHALEEWSHYFRLPIMFNEVYLTPEDKIEPNLYNIPQDVMRPIKRSKLEIITAKCRITSNLYGNTTLGSNMSVYSDFMDTESVYTGMYNTRQLGGIDIFLGQLHACFYEKPNRLRFNYPGTNPYQEMFEIRVFLSQPANLIGISETREHDFYELCKLNVMNIIYNNDAKYIESLSSGRGNINIRIDDWANADTKKEELLQKLHKYSILEQGESKVM